MDIDVESLSTLKAAIDHAKAQLLAPALGELSRNVADIIIQLRATTDVLQKELKALNDFLVNIKIQVGT